MKTLYKNIKFLYLLLAIALFFGCGTGETGANKDPGGTLTIHSPSFPEIQGMVSKVAAYLQEDVAGFNCPLTVDSDTTLSGQCSDIPNGTHTYTIKYVHTDTGVILATTVSAATMEQGQNHDITFPTLSKNYDDDGDGYANVVEIGNGSNPKDPNSYPYDTTPPDTPALLLPSDGYLTSDNTPTFDWSDVTDASGVTYELQVDNTPDFSSTIELGKNGLSQSTYTLQSTEGLPDGTYYWRVRARDKSPVTGSDGYTSNPGQWSLPRSLTISTGQPGSAPSVPASITATAGDGQVTINWNAVSGATSYNIYWSTTSGVTKSIGTNISNVNNPYTHTGLTNSTTYYYVVTAVNSYGESSESSQVSGAPGATGLILSENFEDNILDSRISIETVGTFNSNPGIKTVTNFGSTKAFGYGSSTCGASCFDNYVTNFKITFPGPTYVSSISFKEMELYGNWGSCGVIYLDGNGLTPYAGSCGTNNFGRTPHNDGQADTSFRSQAFTINMYVTVIELRVVDITSSSEIFIDDVEIFGSSILETTAPFNPTSAAGYNTSGKTTTLSAGTWYNYSAPYFEWSGASDGTGSGIAGYYVYFGTNSTADPVTSGTYQTEANYTVSGPLTSGSTYYILIKAKDSAGNTASSTYAAFTFQYDSSSPVNTTGSNFINSGAMSTNSTNVTLTLSATDNAGVTAYCAKESSATPSVNDTCWTSITSITSYSAGVTFTMSSGDGTKTVYVWFKDAAGNVSGVVSDSITLASPPSAPTGVTGTPGDGQATISWNPVSGATSYNIYWATTSGVTKTTGTKISGITAASYAHTGLTNGTAYYYVVTAVNDNGESVESAEVTVTPQTTVPLPETGQTTCYDSSGNVIACAGTGQDGELQRGVAWPYPRFRDNGDSTVTDNLTGLVWTKDGNAPGPVACTPAVTKTWQVALDYVACLNSNSYLGYTDWRLPNMNELRSLVHYGQSNTPTWLNLQGFNNVQSHYYWSSTSYAYYTDYAWIVSMWYAPMYNGSKSSYYYVWPVRSGQSGLLGNSTISIPKTGQTTCYDSSGNIIACAGTGQDGELQRGVAWPYPRFTYNGDSTVTDNLTGLVWTKDGNTPGPAVCSPATTKTWQDALDYVACLNSNSYLGYTDWRLSNINELRSMAHYGQSNTATWLNSQGFNNVQSYYYWSSTSGADGPFFAWIVNMWYGSMSFGYKSNGYYYVWPVRSGQ